MDVNNGKLVKEDRVKQELRRKISEFDAKMKRELGRVSKRGKKPLN